MWRRTLHFAWPCRPFAASLCSNAAMVTTIALSSSYGADGAQIGRAVAHSLGIEFFDRAIPVAVARELAVDVEQAIANDWRAPGRMARVLSALASVSISDAGAELNSATYANLEAFRRTTESVLRKIADGVGGVILGRAGVVVLRDHPNVLSVRLDGPVEARIRQALSERAIDEATARREQRETDEARETYMRTFYGQSLGNPELYQVMLDSTALSRETCAEIILKAAADLHEARST